MGISRGPACIGSPQDYEGQYIAVYFDDGTKVLYSDRLQQG